MRFGATESQLSQTAPDIYVAPELSADYRHEASIQAGGLEHTGEPRQADHIARPHECPKCGKWQCESEVYKHIKLAERINRVG